MKPAFIPCFCTLPTFCYALYHILLIKIHREFRKYAQDFGYLPSKQGRIQSFASAWSFLHTLICTEYYIIYRIFTHVIFFISAILNFFIYFYSFRFALFCFLMLIYMFPLNFMCNGVNMLNYE